jgi:hypothetical protein
VAYMQNAALPSALYTIDVALSIPANAHCFPSQSAPSGIRAMERERNPAQCRSQGCAFVSEEVYAMITAPPISGTGLDACTSCGG